MIFGVGVKLLNHKATYDGRGEEAADPYRKCSHLFSVPANYAVTTNSFQAGQSGLSSSLLSSLAADLRPGSASKCLLGASLIKF